MSEGIATILKGRHAPESKPLVIKPTLHEMLYPDSATNVMRNLLNPIVAEPRNRIVVPECDRSASELKELKDQGRIVIYNPGLSLEKLIEIWPNYKNKKRFQLGAMDLSKIPQSGWLDIESSIESPYLDITEEQLEAYFWPKKKEGQTVTTYLIGSLLMKELTGRYFDEFNTFSRLTGTRYKDGSSVRAFTQPDGTPIFNWEFNKDVTHFPRLGGRSQSK